MPKDDNRKASLSDFDPSEMPILAKHVFEIPTETYSSSNSSGSQQNQNLIAYKDSVPKESSMAYCLWCKKSFTFVTWGHRSKKFCSPSCKNLFNGLGRSIGKFILFQLPPGKPSQIVSEVRRARPELATNGPPKSDRHSILPQELTSALVALPKPIRIQIISLIEVSCQQEDES